MATINRTRLAFAIPILIFISCTLISFSGKFKQHPDSFSLAILADLLLVAPLLYFILIRKTSISAFSALRVCMAGIVLAGMLLSKNDSQVLSTLKTWIAPLIELTLIGLIILKFHHFRKKISRIDPVSVDFLLQCRAILKVITGNEKAANIIASEVGVFIMHSVKKAGTKKTSLLLIRKTGQY